MTRRQFERLLYRTGSRMNDYNAIKKAVQTGSARPLIDRVERRALWRLAGRIINGLVK